MYTFFRTNLRWLLGCFVLTFFSVYGQTSFISIWGLEIREAFNLTHGGFGTIYMFATLFSALCLVYVGKSVDSFSITRCSIIVIVFLALGCFIMSFSRNIFMLFLAIFMLRLLGQGMMGHIAITAMGRWYSANRGKAVSIAGTGFQVAEGIIPLVFFYIVLYFEWRVAWIIAGLSLLLLALPISTLLLRIPRVPTGQSAHSPRQTSKIDWTRPEVLRDIWFWLICFGILAAPFMATAIWFHQDYLVEINNWDYHLWYSSFSVLAIGTISSSLLTGLAVDRYTATRLLFVPLATLSIACLLLGLLSSSSMIFVIMFSLGVSHGITLTIFSAIWAEVYGTKHLGSIRALSMALMVFATSAGPGLTGYLIDVGIPFKVQLLYFSFYCLACVPLMFLGSRVLYNRSMLSTGLEVSSV